MKITVITCYDQNDYVRARSLRTAFQAMPGVETRIVKNLHKGLVRYIEVPLKLLRELFTGRPDAYVITFRGYEMLPFVLLIKGRKPLIFDEFINPAEYLAEHGKLKLDSALGRLFVHWYASLLKRCHAVLTDTTVHAAYSARLCGLPADKYITLLVSADETIFHPVPGTKKPQDGFEVFYYGNGMTPLHGLEFVLAAAVSLQDEPSIHFTIIGGKQAAAAACDQARQQGANLTYQPWVDFEEIPRLAAQANLCLGGPFGKTLQSGMVVTGKTYQFLAVGTAVVVGENQATGLFSDKENCLLVTQADSEALGRAIRWAYRHPTELKKIAAEGQDLYKQHFSQAVVNRAVDQLVQQLS